MFSNISLFFEKFQQYPNAPLEIWGISLRRFEFLLDFEGGFWMSFT